MQATPKVQWSELNKLLCILLTTSTFTNSELDHTKTYKKGTEMSILEAKQQLEYHRNLAIYYKQANVKVDKMLSALPDFRVVTCIVEYSCTFSVLWHSYRPRNSGREQVRVHFYLWPIELASKKIRIDHRLGQIYVFCLT